MPRRPPTRSAQRPRSASPSLKPLDNAPTPVPRPRWFIEEILPKEYRKQVQYEMSQDSWHQGFRSHVLASDYDKPKGAIQYRILVARAYDENMVKRLLGVLAFLPSDARFAKCGFDSTAPTVYSFKGLWWNRSEMEDGKPMPSERAAEVHGFEVRHDVQRLGIGSALLAVAKRKHDALVVGSWKPSAEEFYRARGFVLSEWSLHRPRSAKLDPQEDTLHSGCDAHQTEAKGRNKHERTEPGSTSGETLSMKYIPPRLLHYIAPMRGFLLRGGCGVA